MTETVANRRRCQQGISVIWTIRFYPFQNGDNIRICPKEITVRHEQRGHIQGTILSTKQLAEIRREQRPEHHGLFHVKVVESREVVCDNGTVRVAHVSGMTLIDPLVICVVSSTANCPCNELIKLNLIGNLDRIIVCGRPADNGRKVYPAILELCRNWSCRDGFTVDGHVVQC